MVMGSLHSASFKDLQAFVGIVLSAGTYLFDFSSNIATAYEYHHMVEVRPSWIGIFIAMLTVMAIAHITNAVIFKLELKKEDQPLKAAYLFPLMQLSRLVRVLWRTCSWKGLGNLKADDKNTLYNILSVSLETGPQLTLQFVVFLLYYTKTGGRPPKTLMVSIFASFLSGTINGGLAVLAVSRIKTRDTSWRLKMVAFIISGLFTASALLLQCLTYTVLMLWGWNNGYPIAGYVTMELSFYFILFMLLLRRRPSASNALRAYCNGKRFLHCVALSYFSAKIGALQPLTSDARVKDELGRPVYWYRLLLVSAVHLCLYAGVFLLCLVGPLHARWWSLCPEHLSIMSPDQMKGFPCGWYAPATIMGMLLYSITISSHIVMDSYVNRKEENSCLRIHPVLSTTPCGSKEGWAELEFETWMANNIDDTNTSMHKELHEIDDGQKGYVDEEEEGCDDGKHGEVIQIACEVPSESTKELHEIDDGQKGYVDEEEEGCDDGKHGEVIQIACEVPSESTKEQRSHGQGEISYAETTRDLERSHDQVEISYETTREHTCNKEIMEITTPQISCKEPSQGSISTVAERCEATTESISIPTDNMGFQEDEQSG